MHGGECSEGLMHEWTRFFLACRCRTAVTGQAELHSTCPLLSSAAAPTHQAAVTTPAGRSWRPADLINFGALKPKGP